jgi:hypothetical protein
MPQITSYLIQTRSVCSYFLIFRFAVCLLCSSALVWHPRNSPSRFTSHLNQNNVVLLDLFGTLAFIFFRLGLTTHVAINKHKVDLDMIFWYCLIFAGVRTKPSCDRNRRERD